MIFFCDNLICKDMIVIVLKHVYTLNVGEYEKSLRFFVSRAGELRVFFVNVDVFSSAGVQAPIRKKTSSFFSSGGLNPSERKGVWFCRLL